MRVIGKILTILSFVVGAILLISSFAIGFGKGNFSDDFWFWLISAITSFCILFFTGRYLNKNSNNEKQKTSSKVHMLKTIASILFIIGIILSIIVIIISFQNSADGLFGLFIVLPIVFGTFFVLGILLLIIHYFINKK